MMKMTESQEMLIGLISSGGPMLAVDAVFDGQPVIMLVAPIAPEKINGAVMTVPLALITDVDFLKAHGEKLKNMSGVSPYMPHAAELDAILRPEKSGKA
jgi:hypothetical protein